MSDFMQPELYHGWYYEVDTTDGLYFVPADVVGCNNMDECTWRELRDFVDASTDPESWTISVKRGYLGRYTASGYMDATDWMPGTNKHKLLRELKEMYGD